MNAYEKIALAIIVQARKDALAGSAEAREWISTTGREWLDALQISQDTINKICEAE